MFGPSEGDGEHACWFRHGEGSMLGMDQPIRVAHNGCIPDELSATNLQEHLMLSDFTASATVAVKNLKAVRSFYEGILGFKPIGSTLRGAQAFKVSGATVVIYESHRF